jgi:hypothetical protein
MLRKKLIHDGKEYYERIRKSSSTKEYNSILQELSNIELKHTPTVEALKVKIQSTKSLKELINWFTKNSDFINAFNQEDQVYLHNILNERLSSFGQ